MKYSKELTAGTTPMLVLSVMKKEDMYGYKIIKELEMRSEQAFCLKEGTLYPICTRLKKKSCLKATGKLLTAEKENTITSLKKA